MVGCCEHSDESSRFAAAKNFLTSCAHLLHGVRLLLELTMSPAVALRSTVIVRRRKHDWEELTGMTHPYECYV